MYCVKFPKSSARSEKDDFEATDEDELYDPEKDPNKNR